MVLWENPCAFNHYSFHKPYCRYYRRPRNIEPCGSCHALSNWEEKTKIPKYKELRF
jgi:hypothetical protein